MAATKATVVMATMVGTGAITAGIANTGTATDTAMVATASIAGAGTGMVAIMIIAGGLAGQSAISESSTRRAGASGGIDEVIAWWRGA